MDMSMEQVRIRIISSEGDFFFFFSFFFSFFLVFFWVSCFDLAYPYLSILSRSQTKLPYMYMYPKRKKNTYEVASSEISLRPIRIPRSDTIFVLYCICIAFALPSNMSRQGTYLVPTCR